jgi:hypothetical protein
MSKIPEGFTDEGASPGWLTRRRSRIDRELTEAKLENKRLQARLDLLLGRVEKLEQDNGAETAD